MLTKLSCTQCGAPIEVAESTLDDAFMYVDEDTFIFIGNSTQSETLKCGHCSTTFERKGEVKRHASDSSYTAVQKGSGAIAQGQGAMAVGDGSIMIKGNVSGSNILMGSDNTVVQRQTSDGTTVTTVISQGKKPKR